MVYPVFQSNNTMAISKMRKYAKEMLPDKNLPENNYKVRYLRNSFITGSFFGLFSYFAMEHFKQQGCGLKALGVGICITLAQYIGMLTGRIIEKSINSKQIN